jgi:hypothetical protein
VSFHLQGNHCVALGFVGSSDALVAVLEPNGDLVVVLVQLEVVVAAL